MIIKYLKNGRKKSIKRSNSDVRILVKQDYEHIQVKVKALADITLLNAGEVIPFNLNFHDFYFLNGYQSWTDTKEYYLRYRLRNIKKSPHIIIKKYGLYNYGDSSFYKYSIKRSHGYDIFYSRGEHESFIYNLNGKNAYLLVELIKDKKDLYLSSLVKGKELKKGDEFVIFDYCFYDNFEQGLASFHKAFPLLNGEQIFGYTSWYNYYQDINEEIILRDLSALDDRFNVFQIDDGYETFVGDWLDIDKKKFPNGLKGIVDKIHAKGLKAGIWLAPYALEKESKTYKEHPDWVLKDKKGKPILAGGNWSGFYALDFDNKDAMEYVKKCLNYYMDLGFDFFKLDFLYAIAVGEYKGRNRCEVQDQAYQYLRDILKDKLILGCGANIINSAGKFDYLRIGPDVSLSFDDAPVMRLLHRERISTKVTLQNTIFRSIFDKHLFLNDPDVFLLRDENIQLSFEQRKALTILNALFGSVLMTSDNIATYDEEKKEVLNKALDIFKNGKVISYRTDYPRIHIKYELHGQKYDLIYHKNKGVFLNER